MLVSRLPHDGNYCAIIKMSRGIAEAPGQAPGAIYFENRWMLWQNANILKLLTPSSGKTAPTVSGGTLTDAGTKN